jgi:hypothetical protein
MAYYTRKKGKDLWKPTIFTIYGFCLCCKNEVSPGQAGFKGHTDPRTEKTVLCGPCMDQWTIMPGRLCDIPRFKLR